MSQGRLGFSVWDSELLRERAKDDDEACRDMPQEEDDGAAAKEPEDRSQKPERPCQRVLT